jgi:hypothetical protein
MADLAKREAARSEAEDKEAQQAMEEIVSQLPTSGVPRAAQREGVVDTPDAKLFFAEIEAATGEKIDPKAFGVLHKTGSTLSEYLAAVKPAEKGGSS